MMNWQGRLRKHSAAPRLKGIFAVTSKELRMKGPIACMDQGFRDNLKTHYFHRGTSVNAKAIAPLNRASALQAVMAMAHALAIVLPRMVAALQPVLINPREAQCRITIHSSRRRFAARLNSGVRVQS